MASSIETLIQRGYGYVLAVQVEGIPHLFVERVPQRVDADAAPTVPSGYTGVSAALLVRDGDKLTQEVDREAGVARGSAWDMTLSWDVLEDDGLLADYFARPGTRTRLGSDVDGSDTSITLEDASAWGTSGSAWLGREYVTWSGKTVNTLTGVTRGGAGGWAMEYLTTDPSTYAELTDRPVVWRGRHVLVYLHVVSPEGRILDDTWLTGDYGRPLWRGYVSDVPRPGTEGMGLRCLPLVRLLDQEFGTDNAGDILAMAADDLPSYTFLDDGQPSFFTYPIVVTKDSYLTFTVTYSGTGSGTTTLQAPSDPSPTGDYRVMTIGEWLMEMRNDLVTQAGSIAWISSVKLTSMRVEDGFAIVEVQFIAAGGYAADSGFVTYPGQATYWWGPKGALPKMETGFGTAEARFELSRALFLDMDATGWWLPVRKTEGTGLSDVVWPTTGYGLCDVGDRREIVAWDEADDTHPNYVLLRLSRRRVGGTPKATLIAGGTVKVLSGAYDTLGRAMRTVMESSGTGLRGSYDTLALGGGYGLPDDWLADGLLTPAPQLPQEMHLFATGRTSLARLAGGALVLAGRCLVQRYDADAGEVVLTVVDVDPSETYQATELGASDVELVGVTAPEVQDAPNQVQVTTGFLGEGTPVLVRSVPRVQAEGPRSLDLSVPIDGVATIVGLATAVIMRGDGQAVVDIPVAPWVSLQVGDPVDLTLAHPLSYDWSSGSRSAASLVGRVVGESLDLYTGRRRVQVLLAGQLAARLLLCPTATVASPSGSQFDVAAADVQWFKAGETITLYNEGLESTELATRVIDTVAGTTITCTSALPAFVAAGTRVTFPALASASASQSGSFMYASSTKAWRT